jgi:hypothetical protein
MEAGMNIQFCVQPGSTQTTEWEARAYKINACRNQLLLKGLSKENRSNGLVRRNGVLVLPDHESA